MITYRTVSASCFAMFFCFAACQSVQTQGVPVVDAEDTEVVTAFEAVVDQPGQVIIAPAADERGVSEVPVMVGVEYPLASNPAPVAPVTPPTPKHSYNNVNVDGPYIALTFDDGPHAVHTPRLLDILKAKNVKATFYVLGRLVETYPDIAKRIVAEGHEIANHTWSHPSLNKLGAATVKREMDRTTAVIQKVTGVTPTTMRPPYGATNARLNKRMDEEFGLKVIMWSVDPLDWKHRNAARITKEILEKTQPGGIVLAHDIHKTTIDAMAGTIDGLKAKGFRFVTVEQLLAMERGTPRLDNEIPVAPQLEPIATPAPFSVTRTELEPTAER